MLGTPVSSMLRNELRVPEMSYSLLWEPLGWGSPLQWSLGGLAVTARESVRHPPRCVSTWGCKSSFTRERLRPKFVVWLAHTEVPEPGGRGTATPIQLLSSRGLRGLRASTDREHSSGLRGAAPSSFSCKESRSEAQEIYSISALSRILEE